MMTVISAKEIMTRDVVTVTPMCRLYDAVELMLERRVSGLPVVDDKQRLVGIISEFALLVLTYDKDAGDETVAQHMTRPVTSVEENALLSDIADIFILNRFRRVPVTRDGRLVGIISRRDLMRAAHQYEHSFARPEILVRHRAFRQDQHAEENSPATKP
jgi:CBS domain-containing protein